MLRKITSTIVASSLALTSLALAMLVFGFAANGFSLSRSQCPVPPPRAEEPVCNDGCPRPNSGVIRFLEALDNDPRSKSSPGRAIIYLEITDDGPGIQ